MSGTDVRGLLCSIQGLEGGSGFPSDGLPPPNQLCPLALCHLKLAIYSVKQIHARYYVTLRICGILAAAVSSSDQSILHFK